jgi:hypothetical protein
MMLAGVRGELGDRSAAADLARHALSLDPRWPALREAARPLLPASHAGTP